MGTGIWSFLSAIGERPLEGRGEWNFYDKILIQESDIAL